MASQLTMIDKWSHIKWLIGIRTNVTDLCMNDLLCLSTCKPEEDHQSELPFMDKT